MEEKKESVREWYARTTKNARRVIYVMGVLSVVTIVVMFQFCPISLLMRLQTLSGAITVPLVGGLWIFALVYMFLSPTREGTFRSQEGMDKFNAMVDRAMKEKIEPALSSWKRIGEKLEGELVHGGMIEQVKKTISEIQAAIVKIDEGNSEVKKFASDAKPVVAALKNLQEKIEEGNVLHEIVEGAKAVRMLGQPLPPPKPVLSGGVQAAAPAEDDVEPVKSGKALSMIKKKG